MLAVDVEVCSTGSCIRVEVVLDCVVVERLGASGGWRWVVVAVMT